MIYEVTLKQVWEYGERTISYRNYISSEETPLIDDEEYGISPESLAIELSMLKYHKEYTMIGSTVKVESIKLLLNEVTR